MSARGAVGRARGGIGAAPRSTRQRPHERRRGAEDAFRSPSGSAWSADGGDACEELQPALQPSGAEGGAAPGTKWRPTLSPPPAPACTAPPHRGSLSAAPRRPRGTGNTAGACKTTRPHRASLSAPDGAGRLGRPAALVVGNSPPLPQGRRRRVYRTGRGGARSPCHRQHPGIVSTASRHRSAGPSRLPGIAPEKTQRGSSSRAADSGGRRVKAGGAVASAGWGSKPGSS